MDVSPERLRRFFIKEESGFRIKKDIRETVVFAIQDLIKDPPFTKLDLVSCRNLLIYLEPEPQKRIIPVFHYALKAGGMLFLGSSENIGGHDVLFKPFNKKWKLFEKKVSLSPASAMITGGIHWINDKIGKEQNEVLKTEKGVNIPELTKKVLLQSYAPASVVTDEKGNILFVYGETGKFLRPAPGNASLNVVEMAREGLKFELRKAIHNAAEHKKQVVCKDIPVKTNGESHGMNLTVRPLSVPGSSSGVLLVSFQEIKPEAKRITCKVKLPGRRNQVALRNFEQELLYTKEHLKLPSRNCKSQMKSSSQPMKRCNPRMKNCSPRTKNLRLQRRNSSRSMKNSMTLNAELHDKIEQLTGIQNDMKNLLDNTHIGMIFLDKNLAIKRFTQEAVGLFHLSASDAGRSLGDIKSKIEGDDLMADVQAVLDSFTPRKKIVQTIDNEWYLVRIMLYRTLDNVIEGVVLTFTNIIELAQSRQSEMEYRLAYEFAESIVDTVREPLAVLDGELKVVSASRSFYEYFKVSPHETVGRYIYDIGSRQWDSPVLRELLETILPKETSFDNIKIEHDFPVIGRRKMLLNARCIHGKAGKTQLILLAMEDVTDRKPEEQPGKEGGLK